MNQHVVAAGDGVDYDWTNDHIFVKSPMAMTDGRVAVVEDLFTPGGFDHDLAELPSLTLSQPADPDRIIDPGHRHDIWSD